MSLGLCLAQSIRKQLTEDHVPSTHQYEEAGIWLLFINRTKSTKKITEPKALTKALRDSSAAPNFRKAIVKAESLK